MHAELDYFGTRANSYGFQVVHTVSETPGHRGDLSAEEAGFWQETQHLGVMKPALLCEHGQNGLH